MNRLLEQYRSAWSGDSRRLILTPSLWAKENLYYVQEIGHFFAKNEYFTRRENLRSFLLVYTVSGTGTLQTGGCSYTLQKGSVFFIDCTQYHEYRTAGESWELLWVHFQGRSSNACLQRFMQENGCPVLTPAPQQTAEILSTLLQLSQAPGGVAELQSSLELTRLLTVLLVQTQSVSPLEARPDYISQMADYLDKNLAQKQSLDQLAARFGRSRCSLVRQFHTHVGMPPMEYLITRRIQAAKELLRSTDQSVRQIAYAVGIENESHFIRLFRARTGCTPGVYRALWSENLPDAGSPSALQ